MPLLYLHRVLPDDVHLKMVGPDNYNSISESKFASALCMLGDRLSDWEDISRMAIDRNNISNRFSLSFDDGYKDFMDVALPHIETAGVRVLLFITTSFSENTQPPYEYVIGEIVRIKSQINITSKLLYDCAVIDDKLEQYRCLVKIMKPLSPRFRQKLVSRLLADNDVDMKELQLPEMLSWDDIQALAEHPLVDIGAHTLSHPHLPSISNISAWREIYGSKRLLEKKLGIRVDTFAYPYGANNRAHRLMARASGFRYGFSTGDNYCGRMSIPRVDVVDWLKSE